MRDGRTLNVDNNSRNIFQSVLSDVSTLTNDGDWSHEERLMLESHLVAATQGPLCLDRSKSYS